MTICEVPEDFDFPGDIAEGQYIQVEYESAYADETQTVAGRIESVDWVDQIEMGRGDLARLEIRFAPHGGTDSDEDWHEAPRRVTVVFEGDEFLFVLFEGRNQARWNRLHEAGTTPRFTIFPV